MTNDIHSACKSAAEKIKSFPKETRVRVVSHYDADGISAAAIICKTLYRAGYNFHATLMRNPFDKGLQRISKEENEIVIYSDMGSGQIETIEEMENDSIIFDHHQPRKKQTKDHVLQINCNHFGINGNYEACGSTIAYIFSTEFNENNTDLASLSITGMTGDKQYIGGFRGLNKEIIEKTVQNGVVEEKTGIKLSCETIFDSLYYSIDPYYSGISGNKDKIEELLNKFGIDKDKKIKELKPEELKKINSYLMLTLLEKKCEKNILDTVIRKRYYTNIFNMESEQLADLFDSCGKGGNRGIGLSLALGDKE